MFSFPSEQRFLIEKLTKEKEQTRWKWKHTMNSQTQKYGVLCDKWHLLWINYFVAEIVIREIHGLRDVRSRGKSGTLLILDRITHKHIVPDK